MCGIEKSNRLQDSASFVTFICINSTQYCIFVSLVEFFVYISRNLLVFGIYGQVPFLFLFRDCDTGLF